MTQLKYNLLLQFTNQGGSQAHAALAGLARAALQSASAHDAAGQAATRSAQGLRVLTASGLQAARAARASSSGLRELAQSAQESSAANQSNATSAGRAAHSNRLMAASSLQAARASRASSASLASLTSGAEAANNQFRRASVEMAQLIASTRQATAAQLALSQVLNQVNQGGQRGPHPNPMPWLPKVLADSKLLQAAWLGTATAATGFAAGAALKATVAPAFKQVMAYDLRLAHYANTAYMTQGTAGRQEGAKKLNEAVMAAVRQGGGTRDAALDAANTLISRNQVGSTQAVYQLLPLVTKTATAGDTGTTDIAKIVSVAVKQGEIGVPDIGKTLGMALYAGQIGGFELKDMAKWLPQHITMASEAAIRGQSGMARILALSQMAINSAGTQDEAGNNVRDFLHELNAQNTANHLKRFSLDTKSGHLIEHHGRGTISKGRNYINLGHMLAENREKNGMDAIDSIIEVTRRIAESDPKFREAQQRYAAAKAKGNKGAQLDTSRDVHQILMSRGVGKLFANQQSLMGGINPIMNPEEYRRMVQDIEKNGGMGSIDANYDTISKTASHKVEHKEAEEANALQSGLRSATGALGKYADTVADLYKKHPVLAASLEGLTVAAKGAAAALGVMAGAALLSRGLGVAGAGGLLSGLKVGALGLLAAKGAGVAAAGAAGYAVGHYAVAPALDWTTQKATGNRNSTLGGALHDFFNGNAADKQIAAPIALSSAERAAQAQALKPAYLSAPETLPQMYPQLNTSAPYGARPPGSGLLGAPQPTPAPAPVQVTTHLHLDGHQIAQVVNQVNARDLTRR